MRILIFTLLFLTLAVIQGFAGEVRITPLDIVISNPTTDQVNLKTITFYYGANPSARILFEVLDSDGRVYKEHPVYIRNAVDNPDTPEDESNSNFNDFVTGYGATLYSRSDLVIWNYIQDHYTTQAK